MRQVNTVSTQYLYILKNVLFRSKKIWYERQCILFKIRFKKGIIEAEAILFFSSNNNCEICLDLVF